MAFFVPLATGVAVGLLRQHREQRAPFPAPCAALGAGKERNRDVAVCSGDAERDILRSRTPLQELLEEGGEELAASPLLLALPRGGCVPACDGSEFEVLAAGPRPLSAAAADARWQQQQALASMLGQHVQSPASLTVNVCITDADEPVTFRPAAAAPLPAHRRAAASIVLFATHVALWEARARVRAHALRDAMHCSIALTDTCARAGGQACRAAAAWLPWR